MIVPWSMHAWLTKRQRFVHDYRGWAKCPDIVLVSSYYWLVKIREYPRRFRLALRNVLAFGLMKAIMISGKCTMM
jgi:hypothetical protein